jgi:hypothetical protein
MNKKVILLVGIVVLFMSCNQTKKEKALVDTNVMTPLPLDEEILKNIATIHI